VAAEAVFQVPERAAPDRSEPGRAGDGVPTSAVGLVAEVEVREARAAQPVVAHAVRTQAA